jgi:hypothetical protein
MQGGVACSAKRDQIPLRVITRVAAKFLVMNLKIGHRAAALASPTVPPKHLAAEAFV